jgi:hypothetical protein
MVSETPTDLCVDLLGSQPHQGVLRVRAGRRLRVPHHAHRRAHVRFGVRAQVGALQRLLEEELPRLHRRVRAHHLHRHRHGRGLTPVRAAVGAFPLTALGGEYTTRVEGCW